MKPDWDTLGAEFKDSTKVVIGDADCTAGGKSLCDKFGVRGYPTIKYFNPPDEEGEDYKGGRDLESLRKFASTELGPGCSVASKSVLTPSCSSSTTTPTAQGRAAAPRSRAARPSRRTSS